MSEFKTIKELLAYLLANNDNRAINEFGTIIGLNENDQIWSFTNNVEYLGLSIKREWKPYINRFVESWADLERVEGYCVDHDCEAMRVDSINTYYATRNVYATKDQAEASIAQAQLSQLMARVNGDWLPDWSSNSWKWCIDYFDNKLHVSNYSDNRHFLAFQSESDAKRFLELHHDLIMQSLPLMG